MLKFSTLIFHIFILLAFIPLNAETDNSCAGQPKEQNEEDKDEATPLKIGNFVLPASQQPFGLFAFGGNIIDKGEVQLFLFTDEFIGKQKTILEVIPNILFGVTDNFSVLLGLPFSPKMIGMSSNIFLNICRFNVNSCNY